MKRDHAKWSLVAVGWVLIALGGFQLVTHDGEWNVYAAIVTLFPLGVGIFAVFPGLVERFLETLAPYLSFIDDPEEETSDA